MFEITYNDREKLQNFIDSRRAYKNAKYDFTFEHRFIIYHAEIAHSIQYICLDMNTGLGSNISIKGKEIKPSTYRALIPKILNSIKYTGDRRCCGVMSGNPIELIDSIFRVVLPAYGYAVREEQIKLAKSIYRGLTDKLVSINEAEVGTGKTLAYLVAGIVAKHNNRILNDESNPITITTSNIELQNALVGREIPALSKMLLDYYVIDKPLTAILRKGKEHYFCRRRYENYLDTIKKYPKKYKNLIRDFENTDFAEKAFDLDRLDISPSIKGKICVMGGCSRCEYASKCQYRKFVAKAKSNIDFQITNK